MNRTLAVLIAVAVTLSVAVAILVNVIFPLRPYRLPSQSNEPTLKIGDRVLALRDDDSPERGDFFVLHPPAAADVNECPDRSVPADGRACAQPDTERSREKFIRRVVGMPGDRLKIVRGRVFIDGRERDFDGVRFDATCDVCNLTREITIPADHFYMLGDNRGESADSRFWGPVKRDWLQGRVVLRYWPPRRLGSP